MKELRLCDNAEVKKVFDFCTNHYLGIEIQGFYNPNLINSAETLNLISAYNNVLFDFQGGKSLHAPFWDLNLGTANTMIKESTMKTFNYAYNVDKELECTEIVVHNGFIPNTSFYHSWVKNATDFWKKFFSNKDNSIAIMVENQCEENSDILKMEIDSVHDSRLKVCLDIGHANANSNMSVEDWIITLGDRIGYLHLHNNHGKLAGRPSYMNDEHLGLDDGTIDIANVFSLLEQYCPDAIWSLECNLDYIEKSVKILKHFGYNSNKI